MTATVSYSLRQLAGYFLQLGTTGFGGPPALIGYMHRDLVQQRQWILNLELTRLVVLWGMLYAATGVQMLLVWAYIGGLSWWVYQTTIRRHYFGFLYGRAAPVVA